MVTEYSTVTLEAEIKEKVLLITKTTILDISLDHYLLCLEPIVFAIWIKERSTLSKIENQEEFQMYVGYLDPHNNPAAIIFLELFNKIEEEDGTLVLLKLKTSQLRHISALKIWLFFQRYYKKPNLSFEKFKSLVSAYSFPRKVMIVSFKEEDYLNIFPMDLVGMISGGRRIAFGLRHTNVTLEKIIAAKKLVVSEVPSTHKDIIYQLGKHHSHNPPTTSSLIFKVIKSREHKFLIPEWTERYFEINILLTKNLGSHMLLWGECIYMEEFYRGFSHLYHIHYLHHLYQKKNGYAYPLV